MNTETQISYSSFTVPRSAVPPASIEAMISRGLTHFMGSECASKVTAWKAKQEVPPTGAEIDAKLVEVQTEAWTKFVEGKVGVRAPGAGPKISHHDTVVRKITTDELRVILKNIGVKFPKGDEQVTLGGTDYSLDDLIDRRLAKEGERINKEAAARIRLEDKRAEALKNLGVETSAAEVLGL